jgi:hypothetical protein
VSLLDTLGAYCATYTYQSAFLPYDQTKFLSVCEYDTNVRVFSIAGDSLQLVYAWASGTGAGTRGIAFFPNDPTFSALVTFINLGIKIVSVASSTAI